MAQEATESTVGADTEPEPAHFSFYCQEHQTPSERYNRGENVWYSHKTAGGKWCREK